MGYAGEQGGFIESGVEAQTQVVSKKDFRDHSFLVGFFSWWFSYVPSRILYITDKTVAKLYSFFSIGLLLKTLFLPWKRDEIDTSNMALDDKLRVLLMNLVSRLVGAVVRLGTVFVGIIMISSVGILGFLALVFFILSPVLSATIIIAGIFI